MGGGLSRRPNVGTKSEKRRGGDEMSRVRMPCLVTLHARLGQKYLFPGWDLALWASLQFRHMDVVAVGDIFKLKYNWIPCCLLAVLVQNKWTWTADLKVGLFVLLCVFSRIDDVPTSALPTQAFISKRQFFTYPEAGVILIRYPHDLTDFFSLPETFAWRETNI